MASKRKSLTFVFLNYLIAYIVIALFVFAVFAASFLYSVNTGIVLPANFIENYLGNNREEIGNGEIDYRKIPYPGKFLVLDSTGNKIDTNMDPNQIQDYEIYKRNHQKSKLFYSEIEREKDTVVVQYDLKAKYADPVMDNILPSPEITFFALPIVVNIGAALWISYFFKRKMKKEIDSIVRITEKIKGQDLDFEMPASSIIEFNEVLLSLNSMKKALNESLEEQWQMEKEKIEQLAALSHDINTPLAIIKGSTELMIEENEEESYSKTILSNIHRIEEYLSMLKEQTVQETLWIQNHKRIEIEEFVRNIKREAEILCRRNSRVLEFHERDLPKEINGDFEELKRAVFNLLNNSIRFTEIDGIIEINIYTKERYFVIQVKDYGRGFSPEALVKGKESYYSEHGFSRDHFGMGLSIAERIAQKHRGSLSIENNAEKGAAVKLNIPIDRI